MFHVKHPAEPPAVLSVPPSMFHVKRRGLRRALLAGVVALSVLAAGCTGIAQPEGWAPPVEAEAASSLFVPVERGTIALLELSNGGAPIERWRFPTEDDDLDLGAIYATPVLEDGRLYVATHKGVVYALNASTGRPVEDWAGPVDLEERIVATPAFNGDRLFVATEQGNLVAIEVANGAVSTLLEGEGRIWSPVTLHEETLFLGNLDQRRVRAVSKSSGDVVWEQPLAGSTAAGFALADGLLIVGSFDRALHALDIAAGGEERWRLDVGGWVMAQPLLEGDTVYALTTRGGVFAVDAATGQERWQFLDDERQFRSRPVLVDGTLVAAAKDGTVIGLDAATGQERWRQTLPDEEIEADPLVLDAGGVLYLTNDGDLVRIAPADGAVQRIGAGT